MKTAAGQWRSLFLNVHLAGGLVAGLFLLILGVTGSILAFESEIDQLLHPSLFKVFPQGEPLSITTLSTNVAAAKPPGESVRLRCIASKPALSYFFLVEDKYRRLPRQVFVNQYTGRILGNVSVVRFTSVAHRLHEANGALMGCASLILAISALSGLYLWWPLKRIKIEWRGSRRRLYFDLHNSVGFFSSLFLLVFGATGAYMGLEFWTVPATYKVTGTKPQARLTSSTPQNGAAPISADEAVSIAKSSLPGAAPLWVVIPQAPTNSYLVKMRFPEDRTLNGNSAVWVDQYSGKTLTASSSRALPPAKIESLNRAIHTGDIFGYPGRTLACFMSLALVVQTITGPYLWWTRRRQKQPRPSNEVRAL